MPAKIPPEAFLTNWSSGNDERREALPIGKQREGYNIGEAPGAGHLNHIFGTTGDWQAMAGRSTAARNAFRNIEYYSSISPSWGPTAAIADAVHIDYFELADRWYMSSIDVAGNVYVQDSATGEFDDWSNQTYLANVGAGSTGDFTKIATDGTVCAIGLDNGVNAKIWSSPSLATVSMAIGATIGTMVECSDLVYDDTNNLWIMAGRSSTRGVIYTSSNLSTWTLRKTWTTDTDAIALATDDDGNSVASGVTETYYSSNGTTWSAATVDAPIANNIAWAPSLQLFVARENSTGDLWTSTNGDIWRDQNAINSVPTLWNMVHCPEFFLLWSTKTTSTNGNDYSTVYAFHTAGVDADDYSYQTLGHSWEAALPVLSASDGIYRGGQGKIIFPAFAVAAASDFRIAIGRYGAPNAEDTY